MNVQNSVANTLLYENFVIQEKIDSLQGSVKKDPSKKAEIQVKLDEWFRKRTQQDVYKRQEQSYPDRRTRSWKNRYCRRIGFKNFTEKSFQNTFQ